MLMMKMVTMMTSNLRTMCVAVALACVLALTNPAQAEKWSFGVMSDTQQTIAGGQDTVATAVIDALNQQFVAAGVNFVVQVGDLTDTGNATSLQTRLDANYLLDQNGIAFYGLRGNHEDNTASFDYFAANYVPLNSPGVSVNVRPGALDYSVTYNGVKIVLLDILTGKGTTAPMDAATAWMNKDLSSGTYEHAFVFSHKNIAGQNHKDTLFGNDTVDNKYTVNPTQQNNYFQVLAQNGVRYSISGHDHMHHRSLVESPNGQYSLNQLICASDSTKFYTPAAGYSDREVPLAQQLYTIGYYIFTVDGPLVTVDYYATSHNASGGLENGNIVADPTWTRVETFGYSTNGQQFIVAGGASFSSVRDASPFMGTTMALAGTNIGLYTSGGGSRPLSREINTGWTAGGAGFASDILTIWGMEDINNLNNGIPAAPTALSFDLTLSYDIDLFTNAYMMSQDRDGNWTKLASYTDNGDGTVTATVAPGGLGVFALGGTAVPEPATLTLLALGGLAIIRRHRKS